MKKLDIGSWGEHTIKPGSRKRLRLDIGRSFSGAHIHLPLMVWRAAEPGPTVAITAAVHGDEINGTGVIRRLIQEKAIELKRGALILCPSSTCSASSATAATCPTVVTSTEVSREA